MKIISLLKTVLLFGLTLVVITSDLLAQSKEVIVGVSRDNTLFESSDGSLSNGSGSYLFTGTTAQGNIRRALVVFDLSTIPQDSRIESVKLTLHMSKTISGAEDIGLYSILYGWGEGSSNADLQEGKGGVSAEGDATWLHRFRGTDNMWMTPGGDFKSTASAVKAVEKTGNYTWGSTEQMVADVQSWVKNPDSNFGWILIGNEASSSTAKRFDSKEITTENNRPVLTVTYSIPTNVEDNNPMEFVLAQNSPNPFNPATTISFTIPEAGIVTIDIFNIAGQKVDTIGNEFMNAGSYSVTWDASDFSAGVYFSIVKSGNHSKTMKMTLLK
ncbi:MAG: T9SS type A sorting domain-containing protein [Candidatus Latescibacteria bacterium]|nr:T9SS type A sorting domain-containing protein [Candidatus Latescibacterota bacterium]